MKMLRKIKVLFTYTSNNNKKKWKYIVSWNTILTTPSNGQR